jgi:predicted nucleic acid-binding Zn finger protein
MVQKENWEEICGDLHAVRIIGQVGGFPKSTKENLKKSLQIVLQKSKDFVNEGNFCVLLPKFPSNGIF